MNAQTINDTTYQQHTQTAEESKKGNCTGCVAVNHTGLCLCFDNDCLADMGIIWKEAQP